MFIYKVMGGKTVSINGKIARHVKLLVCYRVKSFVQMNTGMKLHFD